MPGRQSHGPQMSPAGQKRTARKIKTKSDRGQNAFAIASHQVDDNARLPSHRLGEPEETARATRSDLSDEECGLHRSKRAKLSKANHDRPGDFEVDSGSDSDGNRWLLGEVGSGDDSDIDSEAAFGDSDEERFDGYSFLGSATAADKRGGGHHTNVSRSTAGNASELDDLGDEAVDLATILDQGEEDSASATSVASESIDEDASEQESTSDDAEGVSVADDPEMDNSRLAELRHIAAELSRQESRTARSDRAQSSGNAEVPVPAGSPTATRKELKLEDLALPVATDPALRRSLKLLAKESAAGIGDRSTSMKLAIPLAKRQQDQLDRDVAYDRSKETLSRWTDTVKHNRRAEHLVFPMATTDVHHNNRLSKPNATVPFSGLEAAIERIVTDGGFDLGHGHPGDTRVGDYDDLPSNDATLEEAKARREQLRRARDLIFREEAKAKRIKKIKSKSYRRVHRKQREREEKQIEDASRAAGIEPSDDELEALDRQRATARMNDKHRGSKWARSARANGQASWDQEARDSINDVARRDEELRRRVKERSFLGRNASDDEAADDSVESEGTDSVPEISYRAKSLAKLDKISREAQANDLPSKLSSMKFMLRAESAKRNENEQSVEQLRQELQDTASMADSSDEAIIDVGRRSFGTQAHPDSRMATGFDGDTEHIHKVDPLAGDPAIRESTTSPVMSLSKSTESASISVRPVATWMSGLHEGGAWSRNCNGDGAPTDGSTGHRTALRKRGKTIDLEDLDVASATMFASTAACPKTPKHATASTQQSESDEEEAQEGLGLRGERELIRRAFAGADVVGEFEFEKSRVVAEEEEKMVDNTLPGWGSWIGDGVSKKDKQRSRGRFMAMTAGIKAENRKDAKLDRVVINEKRVKKNNRYLASSLPHPFENRQQYERSLRIPVGPEWTTKATFQDATKPRILLKQGIIAPMANPLF